MTHVFFDHNTIDWSPYFRQTTISGGSNNYGLMSGRGLDTQEGVISTPKVFRGMKFVRGYGTIRNMLGSVGRFLLPIASNLMESAKAEAVGALGNIASEVAEGKPVVDTLKNQTIEGLKNIGHRVQQCGKGINNTIKKTRNLTIEPKKRRVRRPDYFDFY